MPDETGPAHSNAFGPAESADETRQAQHTQSNDTPTDVNMNAIVARSQALTFDMASKNYEANANRLNAIMNHATGKQAST